MTYGRWTFVGAICVAVAVGAGSCAEEPVDVGGDTAAEVVGVAGIPRQSPWRYWDRGGDLGTAWRATAYDDSAWGYRCGPLGYGETYLCTTIGYGGNPNAKYVTSYFRTQFSLTDPSTVTAMTGSLMYDDGVVVYLNGHEIGRQGVAANQTAATLASGHEASNRYETFDWTAQIPHLVAGVNTIAVEVHQSSASSSDLVFDLGLDLAFAPAPQPTRDGIPTRSTWRYWDRGGDLGATWRAGAFDDSAWRYGPGVLGYGESYLRTLVGYGPSATNKYVTTYFRAQFTVDDPARVTAMVGHLQYDDGLVVYLNGHEIGRQGVPANQTASTLASGHEGGTYETFDWSAQRSHLVAGLNTVAVEVHQSAPSSSDMVFDLGLDLTIGPPPSEDTPRRSTWRYWDRGGDLGTTWRARTFDDATWASGAGPLGYGETYVATTIGYGPSATSKYLTSYFRRAFTVDDPAAVTAMRAELMYDDGLVVYLNGTEIARRAMPTGTITASTLSTGHETGNAYEAYDWSSAKGLLVAGTNVLAVEVHQAAPTSSDLTFDLSLTLDATCAVAPLGPWTGRAENSHVGGGGAEYEYADVHWTLDHTDGCVDHYVPSGTAHDQTSASYCWVKTPSTAPIEAGDGELVIDRSTSPATYTMHGQSEWPGEQGCDDPNDPDYGMTPTTMVSHWAIELSGSFDGAVIGGGNYQDSGQPIRWTFTRDQVAFPAPEPGVCSVPRTDGWATVFHAGTGTADVTWTMATSSSCVEQYTPAGTVHLAPVVDDSPTAFCRTRSWNPDSAPIEPDDGQLVVDRSVNPPTFHVDGVTSWTATETCTRPDGSVQTSSTFAGVSLGPYSGAFQGDRFSGGYGPYVNDWSFDGQ